MHHSHAQLKNKNIATSKRDISNLIGVIDPFEFQHVVTYTIIA